MAEAGQLVGDYQILAQLGSGGMGRVYKVRNVISNREEAMKILLPDFAGDPDLAARFMAEIRTLATLEHPGIAQLRTAFQANNQFVMVMEFVEGTTLEKLASVTRIPIDKVLDYAAQALEALSYAHSRGVIHRDIKPANIMITTHGLVKLMDFGIAKSTGDMQLTRPGTTMGSVYYMSPEQVRGGAIDGRSDLYSFGVTLYEMLTGRKPFQADTSYSVLNAQLNQAPTPPVEVNPEISGALNQAILRAMAKLPEQRFPSAAEFRDALRAVRAGQPESQTGRVATTLEIPAMPGGQTRTPTVYAPPTTGTVLATPAYGATVVAPPAGAPPSGAWTPVPPPAPAMTAAPAGAPARIVAGAPARVAPGAPGGPPGGAKSHRGLWIGLGAVTAVVALAAVATVLPRVFSTHADQKTNAGTETAAASQASPGPTSPAQTSGAQTSAAQASPAQTSSGQASSSGQAGSNAGGAGNAGGAQADRDAAGTKQVSTTGRAADAANSSAKSPRPPYEGDKVKPTQGGGVGAPDRAGAGSGSTTAPPAGGPSAKELRDAHDRYDNLESRADAALSSVQQIRGQQQTQGLDMRSDIVEAMNRLEHQRSAANRALADKDLPTASDYMDKMETSIATLEKFLGR